MFIGNTGANGDERREADSKEIGESLGYGKMKRVSIFIEEMMTYL